MSTRTSARLISLRGSLSAGSATTVMTDEWRRPRFSLAGTRCTRWDPAKVAYESSKTVQDEYTPLSRHGTAGMLGDGRCQLAGEQHGVVSTFTWVEL